MMKKAKAFTLVEVLISLLITGIVMSAVITLFFSVFESYAFHQDISEAKQRGQIALAAISPFISGAALGVPNAPTAFQTAFTLGGDVSKTAAELLPADPKDPKKFNGPVQLASGDVTLPGIVGSDDISGPELWLVYGVPSGIGVEEDFQVDSRKKSVLLTGNPSSQYFVENSVTLKSWIVFPTCTAPIFVVKADEDNTKQWYLAARSDQKISAFDEMHYLRAVKIRAANNSLEVRRLDSSPNAWQPVADGIVAIEFRFSAGRVLQVTVLARGTERHNKAYMTQIAGWDGPLPADMNYRYATVTRSWRIRN